MELLLPQEMQTYQIIRPKYEMFKEVQVLKSSNPKWLMNFTWDIIFR